MVAGEARHEVDDREVAVAHDARAGRAADLRGALAAHEVAQEREALAGRQLHRALHRAPRLELARTAAQRAARGGLADVAERDRGADARDLVVVLDGAQQPQRVRVGLHGLDARHRQRAVLDRRRGRAARARRAPRAGRRRGRAGRS